MCGRYAMDVDIQNLPDIFAKQGLSVDHIMGDSSFVPSYNIGPSKISPVYYSSSSQGNIIECMQWGLIPSWTKDPNSATPWKTFNARLESLHDNIPIWRSSKNHKRCIVPIAGYYEWLNKQIHPNKKKVEKIPFYIKRQDNKLMFLAGLREHCTYDSNGKSLSSFTIVTGPAPKQLKWLHERMPVVMTPGSQEMKLWLNSNLPWSEDVESCLKSYKEDDLEWFKVNKDVGKLGNDGAYLIKPLRENKSVLDHFRKKSNDKDEVELLNHRFKEDALEGDYKTKNKLIRESSKKPLEDEVGEKLIKKEESNEEIQTKEENSKRPLGEDGVTSQLRDGKRIKKE